MVIYFTGTGNSRYCAQLLSHALDDRLLDAFSYIQNGIAAELTGESPWVFVCPTYAWQMPHIFADFIKSGTFSGSRDAYFILTCGSDIGNAGQSIADLCEEKRLVCKGVLPVVMPENYIAMFPVPDEQESKAIVKAAHPVLEEAAERIRRGEALPQSRTGLLDRLKSGPVNRGFYRFYLKADGFYVTDTCISCGKCAQVCPLQNVTLQNGRPIWGKNCTHCMACICHCPEEAIEYGKKSAGKRRYLCPPYLSGRN